MKLLFGILLILTGAFCVIISILGFIKAFDNFAQYTFTGENMSYTFGSLLLPALTAVFGRWIYNYGKGIIKKPVR